MRSPWTRRPSSDGRRTGSLIGSGPPAVTAASTGQRWRPWAGFWLRTTSGRGSMMSRPIHEIAREIRDDWSNVHFGAKPYLLAMEDLDEIDDTHLYDTASSV